MRIGIVGAGITGITIASALTKGGHQVILFEKEQAGGLAGGIPFPYGENVYLDKYYHHIFKSDNAIIQLIKEYNLLSDLLWLESTTGIYADGRHWEFRTPSDLLRFSPLGSLWQRILMGINLHYFRRTQAWEHLDHITCREFFAQRNNIGGFENLWGPLLRQKFADESENIPASFLWGRIHPRSRSRQNRKECLGYLKGGFHRLILQMVSFIESNGAQIRTGETVQKISPGHLPRMITNAGEYTFDRVVWTISLGLMSDIIHGLPPLVRQKVDDVQDMAVTCLVLIMNKGQSHLYWLNNIDRDITFGALIEHTNLVPSEYYSDLHIMYIVNYHKKEYFLTDLNEEATLAFHLPSLKRIFSGFNKNDIVKMYVFRNQHSSPVFNLAFSKKMPPYQGWVENVDVCNMTQVYPVDRNMNNCVENALHYVDHCFSGI